MANNGFDEWGGYMEAKVKKLEEQFSATSAPFRKSDLFGGISIFVNGMTNPSADELKRLMMVHGGTFHHYERSHTKFIIASNLPDVKVRNMDTSKIIGAKWVVDCIAANRILDYAPYLLYTNQKTTQPRLQFGKTKKKEESSVCHESKKAELAAIMQDLKNINDQMREDTKDSTNIKPELNSKSSPKKVSTATRTAVDPNFLSEFYNNSRLHHIATLGAGFKQYVTELRDKHDKNVGFPARAKLREALFAEGIKVSNTSSTPDSAYIMHIDMDCFFVSVGLRNHPQLRNQPVAVTHSKGGAKATEVPVHPDSDRKTEMELYAKRFEQLSHNNILSDKVRNGFENKMSLSEIASCSYEARAKGIRNGMFVGQAVKLCPNLKTIPYDFEGYKEVAFTLYDTIAQYTLNVEAVSCDEMFVDLGDIIEEMNVAPMDFVRAIRNEVRQKTGCPCSAGVGANKLQARMATRKAKPDGQFHLEEETVIDYMADICVEDLPGVGSSTGHTLKQAGYTTCGDLQRLLSLAKLQSLVGKKSGETLFQFCRGIDHRLLNYEQVRKSVSAEVNYGIRFKEDVEVDNFLRKLCSEVHSRLCQIQRKTKCVTLKVMIRAKDAPVEASKFMGHGVCDYITKSVALSNYSNDLDTITRTVQSIMKNLNLPPNELRGIGIQLTKLDHLKETREQSKDNAIKNMFSKIVEKRKEGTENPSKTKIDNFKENASKAEPTKTNDKSESIAPKPVNNKKRPNVFGMLQEAHEKKQRKQNAEQENISSTSDNGDPMDFVDPATAYLPPDIDPDVFAALPMDIRREILQNIGQQNQFQPIEATKKDEPTSTKSKFMTENANDDLNDFDLQPSTSRAAQARRERCQLELPENAISIQYENFSELPNGQVDPNFLKALPLDLRQEIESDMAKLSKRDSSSTKHTRSTTTIALSIATATPTTSSSITAATTTGGETETAKEKSETTNDDNIFMQSNCNELLLQWISSDEIPSEYDVDLCCYHAREMVRSNNLSALYGSIIYFSKIIQKKQSRDNNSCWFRAYCDIMKAIVDEVDIRYPGRNLLTRDIQLT